MSEPGVDQLISVQRAIEILDAMPIDPQPRRVRLDAAAGLRLAEDVVCDRDYPPFDKALLDGFAVRAADTGAGANLAVAATILAGGVIAGTLHPGEAAAIMTGAPLPPGADAVVGVEHTTRRGDRILLHRSVSAGDAVARRGSDATAGRLLLRKTAVLTPAAIAVAATVGLAEPMVFPRPSVAVLSTGDELVEIDQIPTGSQIRNSNSPMLVALLASLGCDVSDLGFVRDDRAALTAAMREGLEADALLIIGGMSMGERDYVPELMRELGLELKISKLRIKPGKPFAFATRTRGGERSRGGSGLPSDLVFGLPGNPVSAFVCTLRLAGRILTRLAGGMPPAMLPTAPLLEELPANGPREFYQPAILDGQGVRPLRWRGSADLFTLARADALLVRPEQAPAAAAGEPVPILHLPGAAE